MTFVQFVEFLEQKLFEPVLLNPTPLEGTSDTGSGEAASLGEALRSKIIGADYPNAAYFAYQCDRYKSLDARAFMALIVAQTSDERAKVWRVFCRGMPGQDDDARAKLEWKGTDSLSEVRDSLQERLDRGYWPVALPVGIPLALSMYLSPEDIG